jgi:hypothetical protein
MITAFELIFNSLSGLNSFSFVGQEKILLLLNTFEIFSQSELD